MWGERAGKLDAGDYFKAGALGAVGGGVGGGVGNAIFGKAINRAGAQVPRDITDAARTAVDPARMAPFGLTGAAAPNAEQALRMVPGEAANRFAPIVRDIFSRAGKGADDAAFPALRTQKAAQFPDKYAPDYRGSFAQRADAATKNAKDATKAVGIGVPNTPVRATSFMPQEFRDMVTMLRDAAINKRAANPQIPHAQEARFVREAANRTPDPAVASRAEGLLSRVSPTLERELRHNVEALQFKHMGDVLRGGPKAGPAADAVAPRAREMNLNFNIPIVSEAWNAAKTPIARGIANRTQRQGAEAGTELVQNAIPALERMGRRTVGQEAAGLAGYPAGDMLLGNLLRKLGVFPEATPIRR